MIRVAAGILLRDGRYLICRRRPSGPFGLKWEFPGGKLRDGEGTQEALSRELREEIGVVVEAADLNQVETVRHRYPDGLEVELHFYRVARFRGEPVNLAFEEMAWVLPGDLERYDFLEADRPLVARMATEGEKMNGD